MTRRPLTAGHIAGFDPPAKLPPGEPALAKEVHHCRRRGAAIRDRLKPEYQDVRKRWAVIAAMALDRITLTEAMEG